jgi:hypothetical protein
MGISRPLRLIATCFGWLGGFLTCTKEGMNATFREMTRGKSTPSLISSAETLTALETFREKFHLLCIASCVNIIEAVFLTYAL